MAQNNGIDISKIHRVIQQQIVDILPDTGLQTHYLHTFDESWWKSGLPVSTKAEVEQEVDFELFVRDEKGIRWYVPPFSKPGRTGSIIEELVTPHIRTPLSMI